MIRGGTRSEDYFSFPTEICSVCPENFTGDVTGSAIQIDVEPGIRLRSVRDILFRNFEVKSANPLVGDENYFFARHSLMVVPRRFLKASFSPSGVE